MTGKKRRKLEGKVGGSFSHGTKPLEHGATVSVRHQITRIPAEIPECPVESLGSHEVGMEGDDGGKKAGFPLEILGGENMDESVHGAGEKEEWLMES